jgi:hypothetical protein
MSQPLSPITYSFSVHYTIAHLICCSMRVHSLQTFITHGTLVVNLNVQFSSDAVLKYLRVWRLAYDCKRKSITWNQPKQRRAQ